MPIARIPYDELPAALQPGWQDAMEWAGEAGFFEVGAHAPELISWYLDDFYAGIFYGGRVDVRYKELLRLRLSKSNGCWF